MMESGISPLDKQLGGLYPGRLHLLTGGPGTGKTTACLQFARAGLLNGESVALLTMDLSSDIVSHAHSIGLDLEAALRSGQLLLLRFHAAFNSLVERAGLPDPMIDELARMIADTKVVRCVIDPLTPFLGEHSGAALAALAKMLEELGLTTLFTYPGDVAAGYDSRLNPVVQRAAAIIHLGRGEGGINRLQIVQARAQHAPSAATPFVFKPGVGLVTLDVDIATPRKRTRQQKSVL
jgi:KaiC/GvpD/RAD55 family RecA-like ATPase